LKLFPLQKLYADTNDREVHRVQVKKVFENHFGESGKHDLIYGHSIGVTLKSNKSQKDSVT
jgi:hypothetical protein